MLGLFHLPGALAGLNEIGGCRDPELPSLKVEPLATGFMSSTETCIRVLRQPVTKRICAGGAAPTGQAWP